MSEWLKVQSWKGCVGVIPPGVQIPSSLFFLRKFWNYRDENPQGKALSWFERKPSRGRSKFCLWQMPHKAKCVDPFNARRSKTIPSSLFFLCKFWNYRDENPQGGALSWFERKPSKGRRKYKKGAFLTHLTHIYIFRFNIFKFIY